MRFKNEQELLDLGYVKDESGCWRPPTSGESNNHPKVPKLESSNQRKNPRPDTTKKRLQEKFRIVVTAYCHRNRDPENLYSKVWVDKLVYHKILPDDSSKYVVSFEKKVVVVPKKVEEHTEIDVYRV